MGQPRAGPAPALAALAAAAALTASAQLSGKAPSKEEGLSLVSPVLPRHREAARAVAAIEEGDDEAKGEGAAGSAWGGV